MLSAPSLDDFVGEDNLARVIDAFVDTLDMAALQFTHALPSETGRFSFDPADLLKLYVYGYINRVRSSRRLELETHRNVEVMWLVKGLRPDDKTISNFRRENAEALKNVFRQFNLLCLKLKLIGGETASIDGSKFKADNGRKNYYTEDSAKKALKRLENKIEEYLKELSENDAVSELMPDRTSVLEALEKLTDRKAKVEDILREINARGGEGVCTVDREARLMKQGNGHGFDVCYNVQTAVDEKNGLITAFEVTASCNDQGELSGMAMEAKEAVETQELNVLTDKGYSNGEEIHACEEAGIHCYIPMPKPPHQSDNSEFHRKNFAYDPEKDSVTCPAGNEMPYMRTRARNGYRVYGNRAACQCCPFKAQCTKSKTLREIERSPYQPEMERADARVKENPQLYHRRKELSEHPFGVVKSVWGYGQFLCRGKEKTSGEAALAFLAFNLRRVINIMGAKKLVEAIRALLPRTVHDSFCCMLSWTSSLDAIAAY